MKTEFAEALARQMPFETRFLYYADRESPWLFARAMPERAPVAALKAGPLARWLNRPLMRPVVAACGGTLARADVEAVADAERYGLMDDLSRAAGEGVAAAFALPWQDFAISFTTWGRAQTHGWDQTSRPGSSLVIQLGFPSDHVALMGHYLLLGERKLFEYAEHPIRTHGRPTLAWARVDIEDGVALIEEVQSDWLRTALVLAERSRDRRARTRHTRSLEGYEAELRQRYGKVWPRAMMLATLTVLADMGVREVFMHQAATGRVMKRIPGRAPPASIYTALPKSFAFVPTNEVPPFIQRVRRKDLGRLRRAKAPLFWHLSL